MEAAQLFKQSANPRIPKFGPGDTVRVNFRIREGERERIQAFQGVCIRFMNGKGPAANFSVRRITAGIGIERVFPLYSPLVESVEVTRYGSVRRAKLYYLRGLQGRAARIKELNPVQRRRAMEEAAIAEAEAVAAQATADVEEGAEEPVDEVEEQATGELEEAAVDEAPADEPAEEPADEPEAEAESEEEPPAEEPAEDAAEEKPEEQ